MILGRKIHVLTKKEEFDTVRLTGKVAVVLDVLFATSTMVTALVERLATAHRNQPLLLVCSGSMNNFNLEDFYGAGYLVDLLAARLGEHADFSDAARAARALYLNGDPEPSLLGCRVGRMMAERGLEHEVRYAARLSALDVVPRLRGGTLVADQCLPA